MDLISPRLTKHHKQVSYIAYAIGKEFGLDEQGQRDLAVAGAIHDMGCLSLADRLDTLEFEMEHPDRHSVSGSLLLASFQPFRKIAEMVRHHHVDWRFGGGNEHLQEEVPATAHILHLADRVAVSIDQTREILSQNQNIIARIGENSGRMFVPEHVEAFLQLSSREAFWFDAVSTEVCGIINRELDFGTMALNEPDLLDLSLLFCQAIDFRSRFTATHSSGVSAVAEALTRAMGISEEYGVDIKIAGLLHDIGKLVVPTELLEKSTPLSRDDSIIIYKHPYYSRQILGTTEALDEISLWTAYHHERLDGSGYPFHLKGSDIPLGARILAAVDTFTALAEERPYRAGMSMRGTLQIMETMAGFNRLDPEIVAILKDNMKVLNEIRSEAQQSANERHKSFFSKLQAFA